MSDKVVGWLLMHRGKAISFWKDYGAACARREWDDVLSAVTRADLVRLKKHGSTSWVPDPDQELTVPADMFTDTVSAKEGRIAAKANDIEEKPKVKAKRGTREVVIHGVWYKTLAHAERALKISYRQCKRLAQEEAANEG